MIDQKTLKEVLLYCEDTGLFFWKPKKTTSYRNENARKFNGRFAGKEAGGRHVTKHGAIYRSIRIFGKSYLAHRLAWLYQYGEWPQFDIDHIDGNTSNNRIQNLRDVTPAQNRQNLYSAASHSSSGTLGVIQIKSTGKWHTKITVDGAVKHIGSFATREEAYAAYLVAKAKLHPYAEIAKAYLQASEDM